MTFVGNGADPTDRELVAFLLDPEHADLATVCRVLAIVHEDAAECRKSVVAFSSDMRLLARALGVDLEKERRRADAASRSTPPLVDRVSRTEEEIKADLARDAETTGQVKALEARAADLALQQEALRARASELATRQEAQEKVVKSAFAEALPKIGRAAERIATPLVALLALALWVAQQRCVPSPSITKEPAPAAAVSSGSHAP